MREGREAVNKAHYWTAKLAKGGVDIGVMTFFDGPMVDGEILDRSPRWQALVRTETTGRIILMGEQVPIEVEGVFLRNIKPTTKANYDYLVSHAAFSTNHAPHNADAKPTEAVDFMKIRPF